MKRLTLLFSHLRNLLPGFAAVPDVKTIILPPQRQNCISYDPLEDEAENDDDDMDRVLQFSQLGFFNFVRF